MGPYSFTKANIITAGIIGGAVVLALGFVDGRGVAWRVAAGVVAAFLAAPVAVSVAVSN